MNVYADRKRTNATANILFASDSIRNWKMIEKIQAKTTTTTALIVDSGLSVCCERVSSDEKWLCWWPLYANSNGFNNYSFLLGSEINMHNSAEQFFSYFFIIENCAPSTNASSMFESALFAVFRIE